jgi:HAMP domain-containing protein
MMVRITVDSGTRGARCGATVPVVVRPLARLGPAAATTTTATTAATATATATATLAALAAAFAAVATGRIAPRFARLLRAREPLEHTGNIKRLPALGRGSLPLLFNFAALLFGQPPPARCPVGTAAAGLEIYEKKKKKKKKRNTIYAKKEKKKEKKKKKRGRQGGYLVSKQKMKTQG